MGERTGRRSVRLLFAAGVIIIVAAAPWAQARFVEGGATLDDDGGNQAQVVRPTEGPGIVGEEED
ncbi:MAG TPA: hypothetical protein VM098_03740 [Phycisphaerae bacterium]|nr:hypothetical protein [Phycisphaerae bacterium]